MWRTMLNFSVTFLTLKKGAFQKRIGTFISGCLSNLVPKGHDPFAHGLWDEYAVFGGNCAHVVRLAAVDWVFFPPFSPNLSHVSSHVSSRFPLFTWFCFSLLIVLFCPADWLSVHFMFSLTTVVGKPQSLENWLQRPCNIRPFVSISLLVKGDSMQRTCGSKGDLID